MTFADITLCVAIAFAKYPGNDKPLEERYEPLGRFWNNWKTRESFKTGYSDGTSGLDELEHLAE